MTPTRIDPRTLAEGLGVDTLDLATLMRKWAAEHLTFAADDMAGSRSDFVEYDRIEKFEERVQAARRHLAAAVDAEKAWNEDNPLDSDDT